MKICCLAAKEFAQELRTLNCSRWEHRVDSSTNVSHLMTFTTSDPGGASNPFFWPFWVPYPCRLHSYRHTHIYINKRIVREENANFILHIEGVKNTIEVPNLIQTGRACKVRVGSISGREVWKHNSTLLKLLYYIRKTRW